jgi:hypothetical protein
MSWIDAARAAALSNPNNMPFIGKFDNHGDSEIQYLQPATLGETFAPPAPVQIQISPTGPISAKTIKSIEELITKAGEAFTQGSNTTLEHVITSLVDANAALVQKVEALLDAANEEDKIHSALPVYDAIKTLLHNGVQLTSINGKGNYEMGGHQFELSFKTFGPVDNHLFTQLKAAAAEIGSMK